MSLPRFVQALAVAAALGSGSGPAAAQEPEPSFEAPPHVALVDGRADLVREGRAEPLMPGVILVSGDELAAAEGRVEVVFGDGSVLHLDAGSTLGLLDDGLLRVLTGRVILHTSADPAFEYRLDMPAGSLATDAPGEYRVAVHGGERAGTRVLVARGLAWLTTAQDRVMLRAGEFVHIGPTERIGSVRTFNAAQMDGFERWSYERRYGPIDPYPAALPASLRPYAATLASHGIWRSHAMYGTVWYPRVALGWRPFLHGRWTVVSPYGWTWIGIDPWVWPTHYYGTWGVTSTGAWFWIPGRLWRPAPVYWTLTAGHIGWAPWGDPGVEVFGFTAIPRSVFAVNVFVPRHVVRVHTVRPAGGRAFVTAPPPAPVGYRAPQAFAVPRRSEPRIAVPRTRTVAGLGGGWSSQQPRTQGADRGADRRSPRDARSGSRLPAPAPERTDGRLQMGDIAAEGASAPSPGSPPVRGAWTGVSSPPSPWARGRSPGALAGPAAPPRADKANTGRRGQPASDESPTALGVGRSRFPGGRPSQQRPGMHAPAGARQGDVGPSTGTAGTGGGNRQASPRRPPSEAGAANGSAGSRTARQRWPTG